ncbi:hypothetical protein F2P81_009479 [Scophthalmus maximus]|uniref:Uncharacterized protein n=1 Tax=Scophthalmus maximus TaxID=52904 RepID=A0A6A4T1P2_SCOMX|nr:hypothetical protein F2P81_009479 [Scophthalmus maximus]
MMSGATAVATRDILAGVRPRWLTERLKASAKLKTCQPLRYISECSTSVFIHEPPMLVLPPTKQNLSHSSHFKLHSSLPFHHFPTFLSQAGELSVYFAGQVHSAAGCYRRTHQTADLEKQLIQSCWSTATNTAMTRSGNFSILRHTTSYRSLRQLSTNRVSQIVDVARMTYQHCRQDFVTKFQRLLNSSKTLAVLIFSVTRLQSPSGS